MKGGGGFLEVKSFQILAELKNFPHFGISEQKETILFNCDLRASGRAQEEIKCIFYSG